MAHTTFLGLQWLYWNESIFILTACGFACLQPFFQGIHFLDKFLPIYAHYLFRTQSYGDFSVEGVVNCAVRSSIDFTLHQIWWWPQYGTWRPSWPSWYSDSLRPGRSGFGNRPAARDFSLRHALSDRPCDPLNILYNAGLFLGVQRPGRDINWSLHVAQSLSISNVILLPCALMACCRVTSGRILVVKVRNVYSISVRNSEC